MGSAPQEAHYSRGGLGSCQNAGPHPSACRNAQRACKVPISHGHFPHFHSPAKAHSPAAMCGGLFRKEIADGRYASFKARFTRRTNDGAK